MTRTATILGCGSSGGVPRVGQGWGACDPADARNKRRRCSLFVEQKGQNGTTRLLIDMSPDLREQLLGIDAQAIDAIALTHSHADHLHGIDDIRPLVIKAGRRLPLHADDVTARHVRATFGYVYATPPGSLYPPLLDDHRIASGTSFSIQGAGGDLAITPFRVSHGEIDALGFRIGDLAYSPDLNDLPPESEMLLSGLDTWIIDALRPRAHPSHLSVAQALAWIDRVAPRRAVLTNLSTELDYATLRRMLPGHVEPAYDGMPLVF